MNNKIDTCANRINEALAKKNLKQADLCAMTGIKKSAMSQYCNGAFEPKQVNTMLIARALGVSEGWLMGYDVPPEPTVTSTIFPLPTNKSYPLLGDIACGTPILAEENITEYIQFPGDLNADFCLRCRGDSMIEARIHDGDIVFIRQQPEVENGEIAAVLIGEETTLKRVYRSGDTLTLMAANSTYAPMVYTGDQLANVHIIGKAVNFLSTVK